MKPYVPPRAVVTNLLMLVCVLIEAAVLVGGVDFGNALTAAAGLVPERVAAALAGSPGNPMIPALMTLVTHMFLHGGWLHLGLNLLFLAWVGKYVEWAAGGGVLALLFVAGGIAGGIAQILASPHSLVPVVGASGAIAAVFGAYALMFARDRASQRQILGLTISSGLLTAIWYAAVWIGLQLLTGLVFRLGPMGFGIAIWSHIGGFVAGLILVQPWLRRPAHP